MRTIPQGRGTGLFAVVATLCFGSFAWGARRHFSRPAPLPVGMHVITAANLAGFVLLQRRLAGTRAPRATTLPTAIMLSVLALFWWAAVTSGRRRLALAFTPDATGPVLRSGPWRHVRHPFYLSYLMFWSTCAVAGGGGTSIAAIVLAACYLLAARQEERRYAASAFRDAYAAYRRDTPMFIPACLNPRRRHLS